MSSPLLAVEVATLLVFVARSRDDSGDETADAGQQGQDGGGDQPGGQEDDGHDEWGEGSDFVKQGMVFEFVESAKNAGGGQGPDSATPAGISSAWVSSFICHWVIRFPNQ